MTQRLVALGDSFSCGLGVGVAVPPAATWVGLLGAALDAQVDLLAAPGTASGEVLRSQVPDAVASPGDVATLLVGLNDVVRAGFDPVATRGDVHAIVAELCRVFPVVLVARLHDAVNRLPLPRRLRRRYGHRIEQVNAAIDDATAANPRAVLLDLVHVPGLHARCAWAVDRIHPNRYGHHAIASAALAALPDTETFALGPPPMPEAPAGLADELRWLFAHGGPWLIGRLPKVVFGRPAAVHRTRAQRRAEVGVGEPGGGGRVAGREQVVHHRAVARSGR
jgi:lysophospholipase L1-like esterase